MDTNQVEPEAVQEEHKRLIKAVSEAREALDAFELSTLRSLAPGASALVIEGENAIDDGGSVYFDLESVTLMFGTQKINLPNIDDLDYWVQSRVEAEDLPEDILDADDCEAAVMEHLGKALGITAVAMDTITTIAYERAYRVGEATSLELSL